MCKYCSSPFRHLQVSGGGKYASAVIMPMTRRLEIDTGDKDVWLRINYCPMCGRKLVSDDADR